MSTVTTRPLGNGDRIDRQAVRVDKNAFREKSGIIEVLVSISPAAIAGGIVDVRVPNYNPANDDVVVTNKNVPPDLMIVEGKVYIAVNNGVPGPSVRVNQDGTWDLLEMTYTLEPDNSFIDVVATLTYTISPFVDLTPSMSNPTTGNETFTLDVDADDHADSALIGVSNATIDEANGYIKAWINETTSVIIPSFGSPAATFTVTAPNAVGNSCGCASGGSTLIEHELPKVSGKKVYTQGMLVFAVNNGKIDANGQAYKGTNGQAVALHTKLVAFGNVASLSVTYNVSFHPIS